MKFGLRYASLGRYVDGEAAVELARAAEAAGFDSIWTVEHVVVPHGYQSRYPYSPTGRMGSGLEDFPIPDPLIWLAYVASATRTIKLGTAILILPQRNPVVTAKAAATLDHLAGGGLAVLGILDQRLRLRGRERPLHHVVRHGVLPCSRRGRPARRPIAKPSSRRRRSRPTTARRDKAARWPSRARGRATSRSPAAQRWAPYRSARKSC